MPKRKQLTESRNPDDLPLTDEQRRIAAIALEVGVNVEFSDTHWHMTWNGREDSGNYNLPDFNIRRCAEVVRG